MNLMSARPALRGVLLGLLVILATCSTSASSASNPTTSDPSSVVVPPVGILTVPYGGNGHTLELWSWEGKHIRSIRTGPAITCCVFPMLSPNGQRVLVSYSTGGGHAAAVVIMASGHVVAESPQFFGAIWASDSRHLCALEYNNSSHGPTTEASLVLISPGGRTRLVARVPVPGVTDHTGYTVEACDVPANRAVIFATTMGIETEVTYIDLADGIAITGTWCPRGASVVLSGNERYAATSLGQVIDTRTGKVVALLSNQPTAISWLGHVVVEDDERTGRFDAVDWSTGKVLWTSAAPGDFPRQVVFPAVASRPGTDDLALNVYPPHGSRSRIWFVSPQGPAELLDNDAGPYVI